MDFDHAFRALTGFKPMSWQTRLYADHFAKGCIPSAVDVPTGLGKTSVMALWLIARALADDEARARLPRRLVYVVDRRAVVDQATEEAERLRAALEGEAAASLRGALLGDRASLPISTLRGAYVDNREWLADPAAPAIVVGTVDMIGSRLLFQGYGVGRGMRPYHAGLLGVDALVVLDEAHLVPPFTHLLRAVEQEASLWPKQERDRALLPRFRLLPLSATQRDGEEGRDGRSSFRFLAAKGDLDDEAAKLRFNSCKTLRIEPISESEAEVVTAQGQKGQKVDHDQRLAKEALALAARNGPARRVVVFCDRRSKAKDGPSAEGVADEIRRLAKADGKDIHPPALLVGARRVRERDKARDELVALGFIGSRDRDKPAFLICTAAGEVGVDFDADHMVSDLVPWERMVQRLGRVNRRGGEGRVAEIVVFDTSRQANAETRPRLEKTRALLERLETDASPGALRRLQDEAGADAIRAASTPEPLRPALSRAVVDAWSMTSLEEHTGRPDVEPWLRGWEAGDKPQTTVVWRTHLPARLDARGRPTDRASTKEVEDFFAAAPPHESEKLETETFRVVEWLGERADDLLGRAPHRAHKGGDDEGADGAPSAAEDAPAGDGADLPAAAALDDLSIVAFVLTPARELFDVYTLRDLATNKGGKRKGRKDRDFVQELGGRTLIIDTRLGGLADGLLAAAASDPLDETADAFPGWSAEIGLRVRRTANRRAEDADWRFEDDFVLRADADGTPVEWLVVEHRRAAARKEDARSVSNPQELDAHETCAEAKAKEIAGRMGLEGVAREVLILAARLHDEGKRAEQWQRAFNAPQEIDDHGKPKVFAKTRGPINQGLLARYRHEFGSLAVFESDHAWNALLSQDLRDRIEALDGEWKDLLLHLVASHHGWARPVIGVEGCEDAPPSLLQVRARDVALRFARLQKRWGPWGLAWWEALLRAADAQASRENDEAAAAKRRGEDAGRAAEDEMEPA